ncbi:GFA family protein [Noviherbaspirillum sp.]|uniref:GFA family protein n=1 Tax=Noviherbaspirillum sp. TaxID=1926288 RepID=UPI002FE371DB
MLEGGCYCGHVRYEVSGAVFHESNCHCSICRRTAGSAYVTWFTADRRHFRLLGGTPARLRSTATGTRAFCPKCGTQLTFEDESKPGEIDVTTCSLDNPDLLPPKDHTYTSTRVAWVMPDGRPEYDEARPEDS